jgi:hypothetical protein
MSGITSERWHPARALMRRWPTALALALPALSMAGGDSGDPAAAIGGFGAALLLLPMLYLAVIQIGRPQASWPVLGVVLATMLVLQVQDLVSPATVLVAIALVLLVRGAIDGTPHGRAAFGVQAAGMLAFGALALAGLAVDPDLGRYLVAAGWFFHGVWDLIHLRLGKIVSRTWAEWCAVTDVLIAAQLLFLL